MSNREWKFLAPNPKSAYKQLFVKGTSIRAEVLYGMLVDGDPPDPTTPEQIAADMNVPIEAVREAIAYCESNPPEVAEDHAREEARMKKAGLMDAEGNYIRAVSRRAPQVPTGLTSDETVPG